VHEHLQAWNDHHEDANQEVQKPIHGLMRAFDTEVGTVSVALLARTAQGIVITLSTHVVHVFLEVRLLGGGVFIIKIADGPVGMIVGPGGHCTHGLRGPAASTGGNAFVNLQRQQRPQEGQYVCVDVLLSAFMLL
jgi:hypothetical protein